MKKIFKSIIDNKEFLKIFKNINWLILENILKGFIGIFVISQVARYLGPDEFGSMNYAISLVSIAAVVGSFGIDNILIRDFIYKKGKEKYYLGSALFIKILSTIIMSFLLVILVNFLNIEELKIKIFIFLISISYYFKIFDVIDFWFQSKTKSKYPVISRLISFSIVSLLKFYFIFIKLDTTSFVFTILIENLITFLLLIYFYKKKEKLKITEWKINFNISKEIFFDSWPIMLSAFSSIIYMKVDQILIGSMIGTKEVGIYYSAVKLSEAWYFIPTIIGSSIFPYILSARKKSKKLYKDRLQFLFDVSTIASLFISILIFIFSRQIINILYGHEYSYASTILSVHIWSGVFVFLGIIASKWVVAENKTINALLRTSIGAVINIVLNLIFLKEYGIIAAAFSTIFSYFFVNFFSLYFFKSTRECFYMQLKSFNLIRSLRLFYIIKNIYLEILIVKIKLVNLFSNKSGVNSSSDVIISLTTFPKRFNNIYIVIESILNQSYKPKKVRLYLSKEEFSEDINDKKIKRLIKRGLEIIYVNENLKSYKKLLYSLKEFNNYKIITIDDDAIYKKDFIKNLINESNKNPNLIIANRCVKITKTHDNDLEKYINWKPAKVKSISFNNFATGLGGILYPPGSLNLEVFNKYEFTKICKDADDIWFKAMSLLNNTKVLYTGRNDYYSIKRFQLSPLWFENVTNGKNDEKIKKTFEHYKLISKIE